MCDSLDFHVVFIVLTMYSGRRGGAVAAVDAGIERRNIQAVGNWLSDCVDSYYCLKREGVKFTSRLIKGL